MDTHLGFVPAAGTVTQYLLNPVPLLLPRTKRRDTRLKSCRPRSWKHLSSCSFDEQHLHIILTKCL